MPGLIIDHAEEAVGDLTVVNYYDDARLKLTPGHSMRARHTRWVRSIVLHNTKNIPTVIKPGTGPNKNVGEAVAHFWSTDPNPAGAHIVVDWDGTIYCLADLLQDATYHAGSMNEVSIGIEIFEDGQGTVYETQLNAVVALVQWLCQRFGIQMQMQTPPPTYDAQVDRIVAGGKDCVGVFGHCHQWWAGKRYDPGKDVLGLLARSGFKKFDFQAEDDLDCWKNIQRLLGLPVDGIPGPATRDALQTKGFKNGLYDFSTPIA